jgi:hypothetical protein
MKTRRLEYYIPLPATVSRDVKRVFANAWKCIAKMLQEHKGTLSFTTDAWTSPNHKAFVAVTVHFENNRVVICMILDVVEVVVRQSTSALMGDPDPYPWVHRCHKRKPRLAQVSSHG